MTVKSNQELFGCCGPDADKGVVLSLWYGNKVLVIGLYFCYSFILGSDNFNLFESERFGLIMVVDGDLVYVDPGVSGSYWSEG